MRLKVLINCNDKNTPNKITVDVCIIGSGPAGLALARTLIEQNKTVVFIERGGKLADKPEERSVIFKTDNYDGIHNGLAFGYGGTGALWGGQLLPMLDSELKELPSPWSSEDFINELREHTEIIEHWVGVSTSSYLSKLLKLINHPATDLKWGVFSPLISKWIPFSRRNIGNAWYKLFNASKKVQVLLNTHPEQWEFVNNDESTIKSVTCRSLNGNFTTVDSTFFVIASGALESPLILESMLSKTVCKELQVGHYLHDHLSLRIAEISNYSRSEFERLFTSFFTGTTMRSLRLCLPDSMNFTNNQMDWAYCHFIIEAPQDSGFAVARDILRGLQAKNYSNVISALFKLPLALSDIFRMLWLRYINQKLAISKGSKIFVNVDFVKTPNFDNYISQNNSKEITINWSIKEDLKARTDSAFSLLQTFWIENNLQNVGVLKKIACPSDQKKAVDNIYDIYHPAGTCAMGRVVDSDLRIIGLSNGFVIGSSVFPKLGRSNPTLTIMALSRRLGITLIKLMNDNNHIY